MYVNLYNKHNHNHNRNNNRPGVEGNCARACSFHRTKNGRQFYLCMSIWSILAQVDCRGGNICCVLPQFRVKIKCKMEIYGTNVLLLNDYIANLILRKYCSNELKKYLPIHTNIWPSK